MNADSNKILDHKQIGLITRRIAFQIYESFVDEKEVVVAGIKGGGFAFARNLATILTEITPFKVLLCELTIDKQNPLKRPIICSLQSEAYRRKTVILADDVLHSGTTLIYGVSFFLQQPLKRFKTAVLIDRNHKKYPIKADFKGLSLSTSLQERVEVVFADNNNAVYLR